MNKIEGITLDGKLVVSGSFVFTLNDQDGFPLWAVLDECAKINAVVDWIGYVEAARKVGWWDFKILNRISEALEDARMPEASIILDRLKVYVTSYLHPLMK